MSVDIIEPGLPNGQEVSAEIAPTLRVELRRGEGIIHTPTADKPLLNANQVAELTGLHAPAELAIAFGTRHFLVLTVPEGGVAVPGREDRISTPFLLVDPDGLSFEEGTGFKGMRDGEGVRHACPNAGAY